MLVYTNTLKENKKKQDLKAGQKPKAVVLLVTVVRADLSSVRLDAEHHTMVRDVV